jgi:signal transduction histidine kinase
MRLPLPRPFGARAQTALVVVLFLGSLSLLLVTAFSALALPGRDSQVRDRLHEASRRMAASARAEGFSLAAPGPVGGELDRRLRDLVSRTLRAFPGVEGGFYLADGDRFSRFSFPTGEGDDAALPERNDPPPREAPYIRVQARQCLDPGAGAFLASTRDVGPSRVVYLSEPVGPGLATWVMFRLTGPEQIEARAGSYAVSTALALGGVGLALALSWNLNRTLRGQRREQERLRDELRRAEHLAALGKLLAGVAHEVRNPLAGIRSTVQLWQRLPDAARTPASLDAVVGAVDRLDAIVGRLLYFSRADSAERRPVDLTRVLNESLDLIQAQAAEQGVRLERDLAPGLPPVSGSANALRQVALNLLTNALQAMPQGGPLRCSTRARNHSVEVRVADAGRGIPEEVRGRLFEPFFTTRPDGTGLGLALCREVVLHHGGRIELESSGESGTTFLVVLPTPPGPGRPRSEGGP